MPILSIFILYIYDVIFIDGIWSAFEVLRDFWLEVLLWFDTLLASGLAKDYFLDDICDFILSIIWDDLLSFCFPDNKNSLFSISKSNKKDNCLGLSTPDI